MVAFVVVVVDVVEEVTSLTSGTFMTDSKDLCSFRSPLTTNQKSLELKKSAQVLSSINCCTEKCHPTVFTMHYSQSNSVTS